MAKGVRRRPERQRVGLQLEAEAERLVGPRQRIPSATQLLTAALERRRAQQPDAVELAAAGETGVEARERSGAADASGAGDLRAVPARLVPGNELGREQRRGVGGPVEQLGARGLPPAPA